METRILPEYSINAYKMRYLQTLKYLKEKNFCFQGILIILLSKDTSSHYSLRLYKRLLKINFVYDAFNCTLHLRLLDENQKLVHKIFLSSKAPIVKYFLKIPMKLDFTATKSAWHSFSRSKGMQREQILSSAAQTASWTKENISILNLLNS